MTITIAPPSSLQQSGTVADRLRRTAKTALAQIPRMQATPNMPRIAVSGTMLSIVIEFDPIQKRPRATTVVRRLARGLSITDLFSGAGGSSLGALWAGLGRIDAYNHWPEAVAMHAVNVPGTHYVADLSQMTDIIGGISGPGIGLPGHAEMFRATDLLWSSPPCPPWSQARTAGKQSKSDVRTVEEKAAAIKKARGSMFTPLDYAYVHRPMVAITENVVPLHQWEGLRGWLTLWDDFGYDTFPVYLNSMFVGEFDRRAPQSRDRVYFVHILKKYAKNLDLTLPLKADCFNCARNVTAVQTWKNGRTFGKYGIQYIYTCPRCHEPVDPPTRGLDTAIDLSDLGTPIADRELGATTLARGQAGLDRLIELGLPAQPLIVTQDRSNQPDIKPARPWTWTGHTLTGRQVLGVITHPDLLTGSLKPATRLPKITECNFRMVNPKKELPRIAGFPEDYVLVGSNRDASLATGNAVTPQVAEFLLTRALAALPH